MSNTTPTPSEAVQFLVLLLRRVPSRIRDWAYLLLVVLAVAFLGVTAWRQGFTVEQILAVFALFAGTLAKANRTT